MFYDLYVPENSTLKEAAELRIHEIAVELAKLDIALDDAVNDVKFFALRMTECETSPSRHEAKGWAFESFAKLMSIAERCSLLYTEKEGLYRIFFNDDEDDLLDGIPEEELKAAIEEAWGL